MTITELREALQRIEAEGFGDWLVVYRSDMGYYHAPELLPVVAHIVDGQEGEEMHAYKPKKPCRVLPVITLNGGDE